MAPNNVIVKLNKNYIYILKFQFFVFISLFVFTAHIKAQNFVAPDVVTTLSEMVMRPPGLPT